MKVIKIATLLSFVICLVCLVSCSSSYKIPKNTPTAKLTFKNISSSVVMVGVFENANECFNAQGVGSTSANSGLEIDLKANSIVAIHLQPIQVLSLNKVAMCDIIITFKPVAGNSYYSELTETSNSCLVSMNLSETSELGPLPAPRPIPFITRKSTPPIGFTNKWCAPLTEEEKAKL